MAGIATHRGSQLLRKLFFHTHPPLRLVQRIPAPPPRGPLGLVGIRCAASNAGDGGRKVSARLSEMQQILQEAEERALSAGSETTPKITLDHVTVGFARSGGPGGQNVNKASF